MCNKEWGIKLGFSFKMRRPPKSNADGSQTLRLYCNKYTGNDSKSCQFAITFKFDERHEYWLLY